MAADPIVEIGARPIPQEPMVSLHCPFIDTHTQIYLTFTVHDHEFGHVTKLWSGGPQAPQFPCVDVNRLCARIPTQECL